MTFMLKREIVNQIILMRDLPHELGSKKPWFVISWHLPTNKSLDFAFLNNKDISKLIKMRNYIVSNNEL